jgi:hypothetical protein
VFTANLEVFTVNLEVDTVNLEVFTASLEALINKPPCPACREKEMVYCQHIANSKQGRLFNQQYGKN